VMVTREICFGRLETRVIVIRATTMVGLPFKRGRERKHLRAPLGAIG